MENEVLDIAAKFATMEPTTKLMLELVLRITIACLCGAIIGLERTVRLKEAGIRTHTIVALGAALMMAVSKYGFYDMLICGVNVDGSRIASCVVTGISFLGAGVIFVRGNSIKGLTTSAGIWATAGIGLALGAGLYIVGIAATLLLAIVQLVLHKFIGRLDSLVAADISITAIYSPDIIDKISKELEKRGLEIHRCHATKNADNTVTFKLTVKSTKEIPFSDLVDIFEHNENIVGFSI